jgi:ubiquinone/menaquinone biosynthesis C-methylase UbiE
MDLSAVALARARARCAAESARAAVPNTYSFCQGSSLKLPFRPDSFELVLLCDGLYSWWLTAEEQQVALAEAHRVLVPGGYAVLSEHLKPNLFDTLIGRVRSSPLDLIEVRYLHNRLWYSLERGLRRVRNQPASRALLASRGVAKALQAVSRLAGRRGAKHLYIVVQKRPRKA